MNQTRIIFETKKIENFIYSSQLKKYIRLFFLIKVKIHIFAESIHSPFLLSLFS